MTTPYELVERTKRLMESAGFSDDEYRDLREGLRREKNPVVLRAAMAMLYPWSPAWQLARTRLLLITLGEFDLDENCGPANQGNRKKSDPNPE